MQDQPGQLPLDWRHTSSLGAAGLGGVLVRLAIRGRGGLSRRVDGLDGVALLLELREHEPADPRDALAAVSAHLVAIGGHSPQSLERLLCDMALFVARLELTGVKSLGAADVLEVRAFIDEAVPAPVGRTSGWSEPALATRHVRRSAVRLLYRTGRGLGLCDQDPTLDIVLPPRSAAVVTRPLSDDEVLEGEAASQFSLFTTRLPTAWALGEATATSSEIAASQVSDVDLQLRRVWLHGSGKRVERWGRLTDWGVAALDRRIQELGSEPTAPLVYGAQRGFKSGQAVSCESVRDVLGRAGLLHDPKVRPASLAAWAGLRSLRYTGRIEDAANTLGLRSLDRAATVVGHHWQGP